jgi:hypothetical protein
MTTSAMNGLSLRQQQMLAFERQWWKRDDARIGELFGCGNADYRRELAELLELPAALAFDPLLVRRLRREAAATPTRRRRSS